MKRLLVAILAAIFVFGGHVMVQAQAKKEQPYLKAAIQRITEINARSEEIRKAREHVGRCRAEIDFWRHPVEKAPVQAVVSATVAAAPPIEKPPVVAVPATKPPVVVTPPPSKLPAVAAQVPVKEKSKAVDQAKVQAPAKLQKPPVAASSPPPTQTAKSASVKVYAMKVPLKEDATIRGVFYRKNEPLWAIIRETKEGKIVDKDGKLASVPELAKAPPRDAILVPFKAPEL